MPEVQERAPRKRKARPQKKSALLSTSRIAPCGRPVSSTEPFFSIDLGKGIVFVQSVAALGRFGCPDCIVDELVDQGYLRYGRPLVAVGIQDEIDLPGALNGSQLVYILTKLTLCKSHPLSFVQTSGWC
jgi:hypothetical protein